MTPPGPPALGRGVVVDAGDPVPGSWADASEVVVDGGGGAVDALHAAWADRRPVVVRLAVDPASFREPVSHRVEPWTLRPDFLPAGDRLHFLVWANTYDARGGRPPVWWWTRKAERLGATAGGAADVTLADGTPAWIDGGPRGPLDPVAVGAPVVHAETVELGALTLAPPPVGPGAALAPDQLAAVAHEAGPARVVAPAGSGKTRVLTERLRHLVVDRGVEREVVLAVAYNRQAQAELEARTAAFAPRVRTLNSLGYQIVADALGHRPDVLDERDVRRVVEGLVPAARRQANTDPIGPYLEALAAVRLGLSDPADVEASRDDVPGLAAAFTPYREALARRGVVDYDEQVYRAVELLLADGGFRRSQQARHRHLLVDEFQDLTPAHVLLIRLVAAPALDVFGVGDDDQVIYGHAGADPAFLLEYERLFPSAADHRLEVNYRSPAVVVDAAKSLLRHNRRRVVKVIRSHDGAAADEDALRVVRHPVGAGAATAVEQVRAWIAAGAPAGDIALLTRVNAQLLAPQVALHEAGIARHAALGESVLERTGARAALAYLRIAASPGAMSGPDVVEVLRRPSRGLPQWITKWIRARTSLDDLRGAVARIDDERAAARLDGLVDDLARLAAVAARGTTADVLRCVRDEIGLAGAMATLDGSSGEGSSHLDDLDALEQVAVLHPEVAGFEEWLRAALSAHGGADGGAGGVVLSTVHRVKGREWPFVVVAGVNDGLLPHRLSEDPEEERRVLHVAVTRGRREVVVLADDGRASPFLDELEGREPPAPVSAAPAGGAPPGSHRARVAPGPSVGLLDALREWRRTRASRDGVPAYVVLHDRHLAAIAEACPTNRTALARCPGMGPVKLDRYGEELLTVVAHACDS